MRINDGFNKDEDYNPEPVQIPIEALSDYTKLIDVLPPEAQAEIRVITKHMAASLAKREEEIAVTSTEIPKNLIPEGGPTIDEIKNIALLELLAMISWSASTAHKAIAFLISQQTEE
jgi:hypothetical protein